RGLTQVLGGMRRLIVDCSDVSTADHFWEKYLAVANPRGPGFGRNLDAFNDALAGGPGYPGPCQLELVNSAHLACIRGGSFLAALRDVAAERSLRAVTVVFR
ncbi:barstar family protein, partial [Cognatilysobacter terrigena]|uniref:barstar family protein n=1 Tax=Cognatilysobacter terrigena TaxID=2488749 RepID=UPI001AADB997